MEELFQMATDLKGKTAIYVGRNEIVKLRVILRGTAAFSSAIRVSVYFRSKHTDYRSRVAKLAYSRMRFPSVT